MTAPQSTAYRQLAPGRYARAARLIETCLALHQRPCTGNGCDEGSPCRRHDRAVEVAERLERLRNGRTG